MLSKLITETDITKVKEWLSEVNNVVIVSHVSPDGDAIGSTLGLSHFLNSLHKKTQVIVPNAFPDFLKWMPGAQQIWVYDQNSQKAHEAIQQADLICCLDFNVLSRIDTMQESVASSPARKLMIDHHLFPGDFCGITLSFPHISSTSELVFRFITALGMTEHLSRDCAECIYTGMMTDTGGFTYNSNNSEIYFIISELLAKGIDKDEIYRNVYHTYSENRLRLMGYVLYEKMRVFPDLHASLICLDGREQKRFHTIKGDTEGFVNLPLQIKGVRFSTFLREDVDKKMIKISLRSVGDFPCNEVAAEFFNGGGHKNASGGEFFGTMDEAVERFNCALAKFQDRLLSEK